MFVSLWLSWTSMYVRWWRMTDTRTDKWMKLQPAETSDVSVRSDGTDEEINSKYLSVSERISKNIVYLHQNVTTSISSCKWYRTVTVKEGTFRRSMYLRKWTARKKTLRVTLKVANSGIGVRTLVRTTVHQMIWRVQRQNTANNTAIFKTVKLVLQRVAPSSSSK